MRYVKLLSSWGTGLSPPTNFCSRPRERSINEAGVRPTHHRPLAGISDIAEATWILLHMGDN